MKKAISSLAALFLVVTLALPASAASISDVANPESLYPVDIILDLDNREIRKVYDLSPSTDPSTLPMAAFERDGLEYSCTDTLSCINSTVPIPDPEPTEPDTPPTTQQDPAPSQPPTNNTSGSNTRNVVPVVFFLAALALAVVGLAALFLSRRSARQRYPLTRDVSKSVLSSERENRTAPSITFSY